MISGLEIQTSLEPNKKRYLLVSTTMKKQLLRRLNLGHNHAISPAGETSFAGAFVASYFIFVEMKTESLCACTSHATMASLMSNDGVPSQNLNGV